MDVLDQITQLYEHNYDRIKTNGSLFDLRFSDMLDKKHEIFSSFDKYFYRNEARNSEKAKTVLNYTYSIRERVIDHLKRTLNKINETIEVLEDATDISDDN